MNIRQPVFDPLERLHQSVSRVTSSPSHQKKNSSPRSRQPTPMSPPPKPQARPPRAAHLPPPTQAHRPGFRAWCKRRNNLGHRSRVTAGRSRSGVDVTHHALRTIEGVALPSPRSNQAKQSTPFYCPDQWQICGRYMAEISKLLTPGNRVFSLFSRLDGHSDSNDVCHRPVHPLPVGTTNQQGCRQSAAKPLRPTVSRRARSDRPPVLRKKRDSLTYLFCYSVLNVCR
jgi:hypothetical protein